MTENVSPECAAVEDDLVELALGSLTGKQRVVALAHLDTCPRCSAEVEELSAAADELLHLAPLTEPPVGFEARVFERLGLRARPSDRWARSTGWLGNRPRLGLALASLAVIAVLGIGTLVGYGTANRGGPGYSLGCCGWSRGRALPVWRARRGRGDGLRRQPHLVVHVRRQPVVERGAALPGCARPRSYHHAGRLLAVPGQGRLGSQRERTGWPVAPGPGGQRQRSRARLCHPQLRL